MEKLPKANTVTQMPTVSKPRRVEAQAIEAYSAINEDILRMLKRKGLPGDIQREIYEATLPIIKKYMAMNKQHMNNYRILGLSHEAVKNAWSQALHK